MVHIANNKAIKRAAYNIAKEHLVGADLYQHLFIEIANVKIDKLVKAHKEGWLPFLCVRIMMNQYHKRNHTFAKQYRLYAEREVHTELQTEYSEESEDLHDRKLQEAKADILRAFISQELTQENFYEMTLLNRWLEGNSFRDISRMTGIPFRSIAESVNQTIENLQSTFKKPKDD